MADDEEVTVNKQKRSRVPSESSPNTVSSDRLPHKKASDDSFINKTSLQGQTMQQDTTDEHHVNESFTMKPAAADTSIGIQLPREQLSNINDSSNFQQKLASDQNYGKLQYSTNSANSVNNDSQQTDDNSEFMYQQEEQSVTNDDRTMLVLAECSLSGGIGDTTYLTDEYEDQLVQGQCK